MVNKELIEKINDEVARLCAEFGVEATLKATQFYDNECIVKVEEDIARKYDEQLASVGERLSGMTGIKNLYDAGKGMYRADGYRAFEITVTDGNWTHTKADDDAIEEDMREYFDEDYAAAQEMKRQEERRKNWKKHLLPIPAADKNAPEEVYLVLAYEPYDWIKNGVKKTEFRSYTSRYIKRLVANKPKRVRFQKGYGGPGRPKPEQMVFEIKKISLYDITSKDETDPWNPRPIVPTHIAIDLGKRVS